jgi:hypothetical protein
MVIRPSQHVDTSGRFYHPYLTDWNKRKDNVSLLDIVGQMQQGNNAFNNPPSYYSYHHYDI